MQEPTRLSAFSPIDLQCGRREKIPSSGEKREGANNGQLFPHRTEICSIHFGALPFSPSRAFRRQPQNWALTSAATDSGVPKAEACFAFAKLNGAAKTPLQIFMLNYIDV